jgi:hypothetical protein
MPQKALSVVDNLKSAATHRVLHVQTLNLDVGLKIYVRSDFLEKQWETSENPEISLDTLRPVYVISTLLRRSSRRG